MISNITVIDNSPSKRKSNAIPGAFRRGIVLPSIVLVTRETYMRKNDRGMATNSIHKNKLRTENVVRPIVLLEMELSKSSSPCKKSMRRSMFWSCSPESLHNLFDPMRP
jgi:hypothetical protein